MFCHLRTELFFKVFLWIWQSVLKWMKPHWWWGHLAQTVRCTEFPHLETTHLTTTTRFDNWVNWTVYFGWVTFLGQVMCVWAQITLRGETVGAANGAAALPTSQNCHRHQWWWPKFCHTMSNETLYILGSTLGPWGEFWNDGQRSDSKPFTGSGQGNGMSP